MSTEWRPSKPSGIPITVTQPDDPAFALLHDGYTSTPKVYQEGCYICEDPEFAQMGLPLCRPCPACTTDPNEPKGHVPADDERCTVCDHVEDEFA